MQITMTELTHCLSKTRNNTAPGASGFTGSFYKVFWSKIKFLVLQAVHEIHKNNVLPPSQRYGVVTIIPKADKDLLFIKNWRPLTLLNTLYKLISSCMSCRLKSVLSRLLGAHQKAYIPDRFISEVTRNLYDTFFHAKRHKLPGIALMVDFEKAFDSVSFEFILTTLKLFGFGPFFTSWIQILLGNTENSNFNGVTVVNGHVSNQFKIQRGCRQGDPIAGYLFVLCIEVLVLLIQNSKADPYTTRGNSPILNDTYADDLTVFLKYKSNDQEYNTNSV